MLSLRSVDVRRGGVLVVRELDLQVDRGEVVALLGPSGAGKSSLLLAVAGLVPVAGGAIEIADRDVAAVPAHRRGVGMVFQEYALFPHMSVGDNIAYGLHGDGRGRAEHRAEVEQWLDRVGLDPSVFVDRDVATLSGGQRQRVALARALAPAPPVLLLDEPLGALDRQLREELLGELAAIVRADDGPAVVVVTHDRDEAFTLGDRVGVLREGRLAQLDTPSTMWSRPADEWVARFLGHANVLVADEAAALGLPREAVMLPVRSVSLAPVGDVPGDGDTIRVTGVVTSIAWRDGRQRVSVTVEDVVLVVEAPADEPALATGDPVTILLDPARARPAAG